MENNKHTKSFNEQQENSINSDVMELLSYEEMKMVKKGKKHWEMDILNNEHGGYVSSETLKNLIDTIIENTWLQAKSFYKNNID